MEDYETTKKKLNARNSILVNRAVHVHIPKRQDCFNCYSNRRLDKRIKLQVQAQGLKEPAPINSFVQFLNKCASRSPASSRKRIGRSLSDGFSKQCPGIDVRKTNVKYNKHSSNSVINNFKKGPVNNSKSMLNTKRDKIKDFAQNFTCDEKEDIKNVQSDKYINESTHKNVRLKNMINKLIQVHSKEKNKEVCNKIFFDLKVQKQDNNYHRNNIDTVNFTHRYRLKTKNINPEKCIVNNLAKGDHMHDEQKTRKNSVHDWVSDNLIVYSEESDIESTSHDDSPERTDLNEKGGYCNLSPSAIRIFFARDVNYVSSTIVACSEKEQVSPKNPLTRHEPAENNELEYNSEKKLRSNYHRLPRDEKLALCSSWTGEEIPPQIIMPTSRNKKESADKFIIKNSDLEIQKSNFQCSKTKSREGSLVKIEAKLDILLNGFNVLIDEVISKQTTFNENENLQKFQIDYNNIAENGVTVVSRTNEIPSTGKTNTDSVNNKLASDGRDNVSLQKKANEKYALEALDHNAKFLRRTIHLKKEDELSKNIVMKAYKSNVDFNSDDTTAEDTNKGLTSKLKNQKTDDDNMKWYKHTSKNNFKSTAVNTNSLSFGALFDIFMQTLGTFLREFPSILHNYSFWRTTTFDRYIKYHCDVCGEVLPTCCDLVRHIELHAIK